MSAPAVTLDELRPQLVCHVTDEELGPLGWVVLDRTIPGSPAGGGIRLAPDLTVDEVAANARSMTLKWSFLNFPTGGAKAGIALPEALLAERREDVLVAFARAIRPLVDRHVYFIGTDLGTTLDDVNVIRRSWGAPPQVDTNSDGGLPTATTVFAATREWAAHAGFDLSNATVAVEGFGKVGSEVAGFLAELGARIVAVSTVAGGLYDPDGLDMNRLRALRRGTSDELVKAYEGAQRIELHELLALPVDILLPCARSWTITSENAGGIQARVVVPSANAAVTLDAERLLFDKGITVVADHVASCGGILYGQMTNEGFGAAHFRRMVDGPVALKMRRVFEEAARRSVSPAEVGREHSWNNYRRQCEQLAARPAGGVALRVEQLRRRGIGWLPGKVARDLHAAGRLQSVTTEPAFARFAAMISADGTAE